MTVSCATSTFRRLTGLVVAFVAAFSITAARAEGATTPARTTAQLEQLVAPIALYPDSLLSQVLMASTYPLEVVEASRWSRDNAQVTGQALETAMQQQQWDPSVKALTAVPQTLQMMNDNLDWTQQLGDAFLAQQQDVLDAVQRLRARADANGQLKTTEQQKVTRVAAPPQSAATPRAPAAASPAPTAVYTIEPTNPAEYYVPIYDPGAVYGAWPYPDYAPFYWTPPGYVATGAFALAAGVATGAAIWGGVDWWRRNVNVNVNNYNRFNRTNISASNNSWVHNPAHRGSVPYRDKNVAQRYGDPAKAAARDSYRGKADAGRRDLSRQGGAQGIGQGAGAKGAAKAGMQPKQAAGAGQAGRSKQAAGAKQGAGAKQAAGAKKQAAGAKQAARSKQGGHAKQGARPSAQRTAAPRPAAQRPSAGRPGGGMNRAGGMHGRQAGMRAGGGGGMRGGGGRRR